MPNDVLARLRDRLDVNAGYDGLVAEGYDVEGIDASADMLAILRRHAAERGLHPTVHHGDFAPLHLCDMAIFVAAFDIDRDLRILTLERGLCVRPPPGFLGGALDQ